jgi:hypothetical protein
VKLSGCTFCRKRVDCSSWLSFSKLSTMPCMPAGCKGKTAEHFTICTNGSSTDQGRMHHGHSTSSSPSGCLESNTVTTTKQHSLVNEHAR